MEIIAITDWNGIVSPMFDASCCLLIVQPDGRRSMVDVRDRSLFEKIEFCSREGIKVVVCGAISNIALIMLRDSDIKVLSWVRGATEEIIGAYRNNRNIIDLFSMPGCNRKICGRKRQFRHHGGRCGMR
jgi:predicted Fe-Mo cluster-binding NifX family protein